MQDAGIESILSLEEIELLGQVNDFNIRARYPDYKLKFYKKATKDYTIKYLSLIKNLFQKLCLLLNEKS